MYFRAKPVTIETAKMLRNRMTDAEKKLWEKLKGKQIYGQRFRRQHPIDIFIVDFYCHKARLVIEIDGDIHKEQLEYDDGREAEIEAYNIKIIRFSNYEVNYDIENVVRKLKK